MGNQLLLRGRWPVAARRYPETSAWRAGRAIVSSVSSSDQHGTEEFLVSLALGRVEEMPFPAQDVASLKGRMIEVLSSAGLSCFRER